MISGDPGARPPVGNVLLPRKELLPPQRLDAHLLLGQQGIELDSMFDFMIKVADLKRLILKKGGAGNLFRFIVRHVHSSTVGRTENCNLLVAHVQYIGPDSMASKYAYRVSWC